MTRFDDASNQTGAEQPHVKLGVLVQLEFASGTLYLWDGIGSISWNGQTWLGTGSLGTIEPIEEGSQDRPKGIKMSLSGINSAIMTEAVAADFYGRSCKIYLGFFDEDNSLLADPEMEFEGRMDSVNIVNSENESAIQLIAESRMILWSKVNGGIQTDESHQETFSGDQFFDQQAVQADQYLEWGRATHRYQEPNPARFFQE